MEPDWGVNPLSIVSLLVIINSIFAHTVLGFTSAEAKKGISFRLTYESNWV